MTSPLRVLVCDDVEDIRYLVRLALERTGDIDVVAEAADGRQALILAARTQPDAIVLDLSMPLMDGLEALPELRRVAPDASIVVLSGFRADEMAAKAHALGAAAYLEKGARIEDIAGAVRRVANPRTRLAATGDGWGLELLAEELRQPLAASLGIAHLLRDARSPRSEADRGKLAERLVARLVELHHLVDDIDLLPRIAQGLDLEGSQPVDLQELLRSVLDDVASRYPDRAYELDVQDRLVAEGIGTLLNVAMRNAVQYVTRSSGEGACIRVDAQLSAGSILVEVSDDGPGLPLDVERQAFEPFGRVDPSGTGLGLSLYITKGISEAHGGRTQFTSGNDGGTTVTVSLPLRWPLHRHARGARRSLR